MKLADMISNTLCCPTGWESEKEHYEKMAGRIPHPTLKGPSVMKEIVLGMVLGLAAGGLWKMHHWNEQRKVRAFYDMLEKGEISVVAEE
ncbi:Cytochrome c oxidase subunit 5C-2 [Linum perenne]